MYKCAEDTRIKDDFAQHARCATRREAGGQGGAEQRQQEMSARLLPSAQKQRQAVCSIHLHNRDGVIRSSSMMQVIVNKLKPTATVCQCPEYDNAQSKSRNRCFVRSPGIE